ncbi:MAG TPA: hypothetical protein VNW46_12395 [Gemmatimonadaceae bacterium]|nr:hypothetical protein [Gemmatimonadaceae bacterium]
MTVAIVAALLLATPPRDTVPAPALPPSPVTRLIVEPSARTITAGDSLTLVAHALDASGAPVSSATIHFAMHGGEGEGHVSDSGKVVASSVGKLPINVVAIVPGTKPFIQPIEYHVVPAKASRVEIRSRVNTLFTGQQLRLEAIAFSPANDRAREPLRWTSSASSIVRVTDDGFATATGAGTATLTVAAGTGAGVPKATIPVRVVGGTIGAVSVTPSNTTVRQGDVVHFTAKATDGTGHAISGLTPTWVFSPGNGQIDQDGSFVAYNPGDYVITASFGRATASTIIHAEPRDVRRAVTVVSRVPRTAFPTSEVWIHPNGKVAYLGTHGGGDRLYAIDISDPSHPVIVDSIQANTRLVNDMMTTPDGKYMVFTREGAADRKNGIVIASTEDPLHPKKIAEFTDGVTAGVHSSYVYRQEKYGTHAYITNDGTGAIDIIDITDPYHPKQVGEFRTNRPDAARYVHDIDVRDGLLYASYWNDGLVILDIGNGMKGGSPSHPVMVSQFKYDLDSLYRDDEAVTGPGFTRGTHTAWRHGPYVFISDEVYRNGPITGAKDASADRMYGTLQVVDVRDIEHPRSVAWYTPEMGGVHNVWVVADTLYLGAYDAGFHVFDISGELKGDLRAQGREIASLNTADMDGKTANSAFDWGVVVNPADGLAYVNDFNNGLWVIRIEPKPPAVQ